jgi:hypothetical protein
MTDHPCKVVAEVPISPKMLPLNVLLNGLLPKMMRRLALLPR